MGFEVKKDRVDADYVAPRRHYSTMVSDIRVPGAYKEG